MYTYIYVYIHINIYVYICIRKTACCVLLSADSLSAQKPELKRISVYTYEYVCETLICMTDLIHMRDSCV